MNTLTGGAGNDTYVIQTATDIVTELSSEGTDTVQIGVTYTLTTNVENLVFTGAVAANGTGNALDNILTGNSAVNTLSGDIGSDTLNGGLGNDILTGGTGTDQFVFNSAISAANVDAITDYSVVDDTIALDRLVFSSLASVGTLAADNFIIGAAAADANDFIVYNATTGDLSYDADGNGAGAAIRFATISPSLALTSGDFLVF